MLNIQEKIDKFIKTHPQYAKYPKDTVISVMCKEDVFTPEEIRLINSNTGLFKPFTQNNKDFDLKTIMEADFANTQEPPAKRIQNFLTMLDFAKDETGKVNYKNITKENILKTFGEENCKIEESQIGAPIITIKVKIGNNETLEFNLFKDTDDIGIQYNNSNLMLGENRFEYNEFSLKNGSISKNTYSENGDLLRKQEGKKNNIVCK